MKYLLTFKPLKHFFFGNNKTFSDDYLAISEYFPQNTQLLGALRLFIAEQYGLMKVYKSGKWCSQPEELKRVTGSARSRDFISNDDLGKINKLSQMFLVNKELDNAYFPTPFDIEISDDSIKYYTLESIDGDYYLNNYNVKKSSSQHLADKNFWEKYTHTDRLSHRDIREFSAVFQKHSQVGIELENKQTVDKQFYSKVDYQLDSQFLFACVIDLEEKIIDDGIIQIGAESSIFNLKIQKLEDTNIKYHPIVSRLFTKPDIGDKLICISDTILNSTDDFQANFTIVPYYKNFAMLDKTKSKFNKKTEQKRIIPTGTISYLKENTLPKEQNIGAFSKMGYNQFITIKN